MPMLMPGNNPLSLADLKGPKGRNVAVPARVRTLIELMVWGDPDNDVPALALNEAATHMKIARKTARKYLRHAGGRAHYLNCLAQLRDSERARNIHTAVEIRDDSKMKKSAAGNRVRIEAARFLEGDTDDRRHTNPAGSVTPGVVVTVNLNRPPADVDATVIEVGAGGALPAESA